MPKTKSDIIKMILSLMAAAGFIALAVALPGLPLALAPFLKDENRRLQGYEVKRSLKRMEKQGLISIKQEGNQTVVILTKNGKEKLLKYKVDEMRIKPQIRWDKKFRLVIFDIPVDKSKNRTAFTRKLKEMGFRLIQKSIWVCPYPCEDEVDFLKELYEIRPYVRVVTAERIDVQADLMRVFNL